MASYLRPRRGKKATAESQNIVLKKGEVFFESPTAGTGKGIGKIKMGDGSTAYKNLPYFLQQSSDTLGADASGKTVHQKLDAILAGSGDSISGDWKLRLFIDLNSGNSSSLGTSYVRVYLKKGIFETLIYEKNVTTFNGTETLTKVLSDYSTVFNSSHKVKIEVCISTHNSSSFSGTTYVKVYLVNGSTQNLLHTESISATNHDKNIELSFMNYIS